MSLAGVNYINIALMVLSMTAAFVVPFELFLFSYAVLGPAHYLTEISWLHDRQYFTRRKTDYLWLLACCVGVFMGSSYVLGSGLYVPALYAISTELIIAAFGIALIVVLFNNWPSRGIAAVLLVVGILLFRSERWVDLVFAIYLPTLIHVFIFTGAFLLLGALKSHSKSGYVAFGVFIISALVCLLVSPGYQAEAGAYVRDSYRDFSILSVRLIQDLGMGTVSQFRDIYESDAGQAAMRFIAFAYTYHYLNWFSKTSVIKWHEVPRSRFLAVGLIWAASLGIYAYDYSLGLRWLFFLSFAHVLLEFPLNHQSFIGIGRSVRERIRSPAPMTA